MNFLDFEQPIAELEAKIEELRYVGNDKKINIINYLHVDTQGSDLKVLKGLKEKIKIIQKGVIEAALNSKNSLYKKNHTIKEAKSFLMKNEFQISKIEDVDENIKNEKNIFFHKKKYSNLKKINIKYNLRYYNRIISDKTNSKDKFINFLSKLF